MVANARTIRWGDVFSLYLPTMWEWTENGDIVSVFRPDGVGALNISIITMSAEEAEASAVSRQLAELFAKQRAWDLDAYEIRTTGTKENAVSEFEFTERGDRTTYWQVWHIVGGRRAAFITYTSNSDDAQIEASERKMIVDSFRWS